MTVLEVENLKKIYRPRFGGNQVQALSKVTFSVEEGEYVAIMGESGWLGEDDITEHAGSIG
jgi:putative ABC transport system ATP-binding protein